MHATKAVIYKWDYIELRLLYRQGENQQCWDTYRMEKYL
jgi:hypothetical protein